MATILLIEDAPGRGFGEAAALEAAGHRVLRCGGGPAMFTPCPLLDHTARSLASAADLIVFACPLFRPLWGRSYSGAELLHAYRSHPEYGSLPMVVLTAEDPGQIEGTGAVEVAALTSWSEAVEAVERLLASALGGRCTPSTKQALCTPERKR
jgi:CheY-like chemotaxis protein